MTLPIPKERISNMVLSKKIIVTQKNRITTTPPLAPPPPLPPPLPSPPLPPGATAGGIKDRIVINVDVCLAA